mmetsp:Transcript_10799/g.21141  ORF Transcript_10799/g.21141 Transcript_10799/m.21141 type:complete len:248 (-) Transcript_10799:3265-4008(-)
MTLKVATFNILNTSCRYPERKPLITETLEGLDCDIIGLQEVNFQSNIEDISLPGYTVIKGQSREPIFRATEPDFRIDGNCMLIKENIRVIRDHTLVFSTVNRCALLVWVEFQGVEVICVSVHLDAKDVNKRLTEIQELLAFLDDYTGIPTLIVGDFNSKPGSVPYTLMSQTHVSAYKQALGEEPILTFPTGLMGEHAVIAYNLTLDYIWMKGPWTSTSAGIACSYADLNLFASDHYAVKAELRLSVN